LAVRIWENRRGRQLLQLGRLADAAAALEGSLEPVGQRSQLGLLEAAAVVALGQIAIHTGDPALTRRCTDIVHNLDATATPGVRRHAAWLLALRAMATGDPSGARAHLCVLGEQARHTVVPRFPMDFTDEVSVVRIAIAAGDADLVTSAVTATETRARHNPGVASIMGTAAHARGLATGKLDDLVEAVRWFEQGPRPLALASALEDAGHTAAGLGQRDDGVTMLGRALEIYTRLGASWDAGRARGRLRELGVRRRIASAARPRHGWAALTDSELEVVRRVAHGLTNREVAEQLFLSTHTVNAHLRHAFTKLGIGSRMELARLAARHESAPS
jgi:DNA-binding CsgD family transcriptional regulator